MLEKYYDPVMAFVEVGTFLVWIAFAQLFYLQARRQRRPRFIIHMEGHDCKNMRLVFTNMAGEAVYVRNVFFSVENSVSRELYNLEDLHGKMLFKKEVYDEDKKEYQGTIVPGTCFKIEIGGVFYPCVSQDNKYHQQDTISVKSGDTVNVFVVFIHGPDNAFLGASRHFRFKHSSKGDFFEALSWDTTSWSTRHERNKLMKALKQERSDYPGFN
ncbi:hypothetical protein [Vreelandella sulfidaeris]